MRFQDASEGGANGGKGGRGDGGSGAADQARAVLGAALLVAAAEAIADCVSPDELNASYIVPSVFDARVAPAVAAAVEASVRS